jgi:adenine-specific DNA methylase
MTEHNDDLKPLAIEGKLPLKAVGIENLKEANPKHMPPHRYLHPWYARRPTPASRLAILASVLPEGTDANQLLRWMQIGPKESHIEDISEYVEKKKATEDERGGSLEDHYGYPRPFTKTPSHSEINELHQQLREYWDGELPTVLDPTAGGGVIPFESVRYGLPTKANEINPVAGLILKVLLQYVPDLGNISDDVRHWGEKINKSAKESINEYYPSVSERQTPESSPCTYVVECKSCGCDIPLMPKWFVRYRRSSQDVVVKPQIDQDGTVSYNCIVDPKDGQFSNFDPSTGTVSRGGDAECLNCNVVMESEEITKEIKKGNFRYSIVCVKYITEDGDYGYRSPNEEDKRALEKSAERIESDYEISSLLRTNIPSGNKTKEALRYGIEDWQDLFSPRQLIAHYEYLSAFQMYKEEIVENYSQKKAEGILTILSLVSAKTVDYNTRLSSWNMNRGYPNHISKGKNYAFQRVFVDNNPTVGTMGYESHLRKITDSCDELASYMPDESTPAELSNVDAADLEIADSNVDSIIIDPPYYSSVMYSELSDVFYVWHKEYLGDIFPDMFDSELTKKANEAVANSSQFDDLAGNTSKSELAEEFYENKMSSIFQELYRVLSPGGSMTVMFTHKETAAWDTLTMSLINSGFTITSTHPITSEMPQRAGMRSSASADTTLLLTGRKPHEERDPENAVPTLWSDVEADTRAAAKEAARDLLESGISLTKTDVIISAFGPTLRVFADAYPVVDDEDEEVPPRKALETAREAVTQILVDEYLEGMDVDTLDDVTEWYVLCWLVHESETFSYDDGRQLGLGIGVDIDEIKRSTKTWRKSRGDISLRGHDGRVQNINEKPEDRSNRLPIDPDDLSFPRSLDAVHAAMHVYDKKGETVTLEWLRERNYDTDSQFKATLKALLQVLPKTHEDWELARDLAVGRTSDVLDLDFGPNIFADDREDTSQQSLEEF